MFYSGDLQSGIAKAIQEQKLVACFVRKDDDDVSRMWEEEWLTTKTDESDESMGDLLAQKTVLLRIDAGTQEAGFLSAFCSLDSIPKLLIIQNGTVIEDLAEDVSLSDFVTRIRSTVGPIASTQGQVDVQPRQEPEPSNATTADSSSTQQATQASAAQLQDMMTERAARLEKERQAKAESEKQARNAVAKARKEEAERAQEQGSSSKPKARQDWLQEQQTRQKQAKIERERILRSIEADKAARRERDEQRRALAQEESSGSAQRASDSQNTSDTFAPQQATSGRAHKHCNLQIRLFDGSSLRSRFASDATLSTSVRTYVSENGGGEMPYNFRQMLTPLPSRNIEISEEKESLQSLGLCPSATLVLVPVKDYTDAYAASGASGIVNRGFSMGYNVLTGTFGLIGGVIGKVAGYGGDGSVEGPYVAGTGDEVEPSNVQGSKMAEASKQPGSVSGVNIRTLADQRQKDQNPELYNGNQLNFEPRRKDKDEDDKL